MRTVNVNGDPDGLTKFLTCIARPAGNGWLAYSDTGEFAMDTEVRLANPAAIWTVDLEAIVEHAESREITFSQAAEDLYGEPMSIRPEAMRDVQEVS